jgi:uncharacterized membrane protein YoaK (UPF0700 family)
MPVPYLRRLTGKERSQKANRQLALFLAFIAGAVNAGGYLAVRQYTSHMTGVIAAMADHLSLGEIALAAAGLSALLSFLAGAACTALLVNWGRRRGMQSEYALPLLLEAALLLTFGLMGVHLRQSHSHFVFATVSLLCFTMGLQNAIITKISKAEIRTTHMTGVVTDIGIELGKLVYWNRAQGHPKELDVHADLGKLWLLMSLVGLFFLGGLSGTLGFKHVGYWTTLPLAILLLIMAAVPVTDDLFRTEQAD